MCFLMLKVYLPLDCKSTIKLQCVILYMHMADPLVKMHCAEIFPKLLVCLPIEQPTIEDSVKRYGLVRYCINTKRALKLSYCIQLCIWFNPLFGIYKIQNRATSEEMSGHMDISLAVTSDMMFAQGAMRPAKIIYSGELNQKLQTLL